MGPRAVRVEQRRGVPSLFEGGGGAAGEGSGAEGVEPRSHTRGSDTHACSPPIDGLDHAT